MKTSDLMVECFENEWVEYIFWVPWEENLDLLESIRKSKKIEFILTRNEQTAVFMAANYWRFTWRSGIALATLWPWATNMMTWVAYAQLWGMPTILITWQKPIKKSKQWQFQIIDVVSMMRPITKSANVIVNWNRVPSMLRNAFKLSEAEKPGAVHLELPEDIASEELWDVIAPLKIEKIRRPIVDEKMLNILKTKLEQATNPIILIGAWANRKRITKYLTLLIKKYNIPFFCSQMWKWVVDERLDQYLWTAALTENDYIHDAIAKSDLILSIGYDVVEKPTSIIWRNGTDTIHINFYEAFIDDVYSPYLEVIWDIWNILWQLLELDLNNTHWNYDEIYKITDDNRKKISDNLKLEESERVMFPRRLSNELRDVLWEKDILTLDNWLFKVWIARNYPAYFPNTLLLDNALATMWAWLATAITTKLVHPENNVVCVVWDGWLVMNLWDLETAVRLKLDITIVVLNNSSYWMIKWKQEWAWFKNYWLDFWNPDFIKLAESFWAKWYRVKDKEDFKKILEITLKEKGIKLIDLSFDYPLDIK